jgi:uncharacterized DUF497 family protein
MRFEWDEAKRLTNIAKHGIDFLRARNVFDGRPWVENESWHAGETRRLRIAMLDERLVAVVWTQRGVDGIRIISARIARDAEKRQYRQLHG